MTKTLPALILCFILFGIASHAQEPVGVFENHADVGTVLHAGSATFDKATGTYTLTGSGDNMWLGTDALQFAWKKVSGDVDLTADIAFATASGNPHKKAVLMIRQSLDADSVYADVAVHASRLVALQYRDVKGETTHEIQTPEFNRLVGVAGPANQISAQLLQPFRVRITRRPDYDYSLLHSV